MESYIEFLRNWNKTSNERRKLQHAYLALIVGMAVFAGFVTFLNAEVGHNIIMLAGFIFCVLITNAVMWALLKACLLDKLSTKPRRRD